jgi:transcriptional regulator GlxA family with amidase domain
MSDELGSMAAAGLVDEHCRRVPAEPLRRFHRARDLLVRQAATGGLRLADLAASCGYFDQAHLAREFRALAGCPPSRWLAEEFRNVQAIWSSAEPG